MKLLTFNLRRELRLALLAAMETCWVYVIVVFLAVWTGSSYPLTPLPLFIAYWIATIIGRLLPGTRLNWILLQLAAILIAFTTVVAVARAEVYPNLDWNDVAWMPRFIASVFSFGHGLAVEHFVSAAVIYVFIRGLGVAQRPLTLWFVGYQFRLGIVVLFVLLLIAGWLRSSIAPRTFDPSPWLFVYFFLSLLAIALARIEEMGTEIRYTPRWVVTLLASVAMVLFIGLGILQVFNVDTAQVVLLIFTPFWWLFGIILFLFAIPFGFLFEWIVNFLKPLFGTLDQMLANLRNSPLANLTKGMQGLENVGDNALFISIMKTALTLGIVLLVGFLLARALNKRMQRIEDETYIRESITDDEQAKRARRASTKNKSNARPHARDITAETIRRIYAALVARAASAGVTRQTAETPYEFLPRLEQQWPEETDDLRSITEAYVQVHYAEYQAPTDLVGRIRSAWRRVEEGIKRKA